MSPSPSKAQTSSVYKVAVSTPAAAEYQHQAEAHGVDVEELLAERLESCVEHTSLKPIYINDSQRQALDKLLKMNLTTAEQLVVRVQQALSVEINHITIPLDPNLLTRLKTRTFGVPFEKFLSQVITEELERFVGMR